MSEAEETPSETSGPKANKEFLGQREERLGDLKSIAGDQRERLSGFATGTSAEAKETWQNMQPQAKEKLKTAEQTLGKITDTAAEQLKGLPGELESSMQSRQEQALSLGLSIEQVLSAAEREHYAAERRRDRGLLGRRRSMFGVFALLFGLIAVAGLLKADHVVAASSLAAVFLLAEVVLAVVHRTKPERQPIVDVLEGIVSVEKDGEGDEVEALHSRWFIGAQRLHVPPHWQDLLVVGTHVRVRVARPPGEALALALGIEGKASADFERSRGLPPAPAEQPLLLLVVVISGLIAFPGVLTGATMFTLGESSPVEGFSVLSAVTVSEQVGTLAEIERQGLPDRGTVRILDATVLPREWIVDPPAEAAWAVLSSAGRDRLTATLEAKHGRRAGSIPRLNETSAPVTLRPGDVLAWRRAEFRENRGPTGRPGDQALLWLGRHKPLELVRTHSDPGDPPLLRAGEQAESLAFATVSLLLGLCALLVFVFTFAARARGRTARARFGDRVQRTYAGLCPEQARTP